MSEEPTNLRFYYSLKVISPLGHISCEYEEGKKYSVVFNKDTGCAIIREHGFVKEFPAKPLYLIYSPYIVEYGEMV